MPVFHDVNLPELTARTQALLNRRGQQYEIGTDRVAAYVKFLAANPAVTQLPQAEVTAALADRVPTELAVRIRRGAGYGHLKQHWDWPRGILAVLTVMRDADHAQRPT